MYSSLWHSLHNGNKVFWSSIHIFTFDFTRNLKFLHIIFDYLTLGIRSINYKPWFLCQHSFLLDQLGIREKKKYKYKASQIPKSHCAFMYSSRRHFRLNNSWTMSRKVQKKLMDYTETRPLKCELRISLVFWLNVWQVTKELEIGIGHFAVFTYSQLSVNCIEMIFPLISLVLVVTSHQRNGNQTGISRFDQLSVNCIEIILLHGNIM